MQLAYAAPNTSYSAPTFSGLVWGADRIAPSGGYTVDSRLTMNVDGSASNANQAFYKYEGVKAALPVGTTSVKADLYIDPSWATHDVIVGMWGQVDGVAGVEPAWPSLEFANINDNSRTATVDVFDTYTGDIVGVTNVRYGDKATLEIQLDKKAGKLNYYLDEKLIYSHANGDVNAVNDIFSHIIFNNRNAGTDYRVTWSNLRLGSADTTKPTVSVTSPATATFDSTATDIVLDAADNVGLDKVVGNIYKDGVLYKSTQANAGGAQTYKHTIDLANLQGVGLLPLGSYSLKYGATDTSGNTAKTGSLNFTVVDKVKPIATLITPTVTISKTGEVSIRVDATDDRGLKAVVANIYKDGVLYKSTQTKVTDGAKSGTHITTVTLPDGNYVVRYNAADVSGNVASTGNYALTIDSTAPVVENVSIARQITNEQSITVSGKVFDDNLKNYNIRVYNSTKTGQVSPGIAYMGATNTEGRLATLNIGTLLDGNYWVRIWADDSAGNRTGISSHIYVPFTVDRTAPKVTITGYTGTDRTPTLMGEVDDPDAAVVVVIDGIEYEATNNRNGTWSYTPLVELSVGTHTARAITTDAAGNQAESPAVEVVAQSVITTGSSNSPVAVESTSRGNGILPVAIVQTSDNVTVAAAEATADNGEVLGTTTQKNADTSTEEDNGQVLGETNVQQGCGKFLGVCWYWWIPISVGVVAIVWWGSYRYRQSRAQ